jgi:hypothetical protein
MQWDEFKSKAQEVRPYVRGVKSAFDLTCNIMPGIVFGDHSDRPKNQAAKDEFLKRLRAVLHFVR